MAKDNREIVKELSYSVIHADDVLLKIDTDDSRLVFYQESLEIAEDNSDFEKEKKTLHLQCEIRLPFRALRTLANHATMLLNARDRSINDVNKLDDEELNAAWWKFNAKLGKIIADTHDLGLDSKEVASAVDEYEEIQIKAARKYGNTEDAVEVDSSQKDEDQSQER